MTYSLLLLLSLPSCPFQLENENIELAFFPSEFGSCFVHKTGFLFLFLYLVTTSCALGQLTVINQVHTTNHMNIFMLIISILLLILQQSFKHEMETSFSRDSNGKPLPDNEHLSDFQARNRSENNFQVRRFIGAGRKRFTGAGLVIFEHLKKTFTGAGRKRLARNGASVYNFPQISLSAIFSSFATSPLYPLQQPPFCKGSIGLAAITAIFAATALPADPLH